MGERKLNYYTMDETLEVAKNGMKDIETFLSAFPSSLSVINVEDHELYRKKDIDLLWVYLNKGIETMKRIELKVDRYKSGNFFFETKSNVGKETEGCFLYTEADYLFYYFIEWKSLYILPVKDVRSWFLNNEHRFTEKSLATKSYSKDLYQSRGKVVPIKNVMDECPGVKVHKL